MSKDRKDYFIKIVFESFETVQTTADKANNYAWGEIGLQVIFNALIGAVTGYGVYDKADKDLDISTVPLTIASYYETDFVRATSDDTPFDSAVIGAQYTIANFALGSVHPFLGTEPKLEDVAWADFITYIGYKSDTAESKLVDMAKKTIKEVAKKPSGKSVVANVVDNNK